MRNSVPFPFWPPVARWFALGFVATGILSCSTTPTGRRQLKLMPDSQMNTMGAQAFDQMKQKTPRETHQPTVRYVKCVAMAVAREARDTTGVSKWEVVVFRDTSANAFALPGGKIGVHTGLLQVAKTPDQLAAVLGHEVGHVIARHGNERVSRAMIAQGGLIAASVATQDSKNQGMILAALGLGAQVGVVLPHGRSQESEADVIGLKLMARAGFNPQQSVELWKNMASSGGSGPPEFLSTHPSHSTRIHDLQNKIPSVMGEYQAAKTRGKNPNCRLL